MIRRPKMPVRSSVQQATPAELLERLLCFIQIKFYQGEAVEFQKQRADLLRWVVLWPAGWLNNRGVTLPPDRYEAILKSVLLDALNFGRQEKIKYRPAYLKMVVQSHFKHHEDEIYDEAKAVRHAIEAAMGIAGRAVAPVPNLARDLTAAAKLLKAARAKTAAPKAADKGQLTFL